MEYVSLKKNTNRSFSFSFTKEQGISPFELYIYYEKDGRIQVLCSQEYFAEPTDRIEITVIKGEPIDNLRLKGKLIFSGKGATKYRIAELLDQMKKDLYEQEKNNAYKIFGGGSMPSTGKIESTDFYKSAEFKNYLDTLFWNVKAGMDKIKDTLFKYKARLSEEMTTRYRSQFVTHIAFINYVHWLHLRAKTADTKQAIADFYFQKVNELKPIESKVEGYDFGFNYTWAKGLELMYETDYKTKGNGFSFQLQYEAIKSTKNIKLRDILITRFFSESSFQRYVNNSDARDSCLNDALKFIKEPELYKALNHQLKFMKWASMPNFSFPDTLGNLISLKDMKGKVFLLDFYFEGCGSCAAFAKRFEKEIYPVFANNPDFKILSVNTDLQKERWMKAIRSGMYTQPESINLSTGDLGYNHPMLKYYNITSFPWVLLVDKRGKVIAFNLYFQASQDFIRMISEALAYSDSVSKAKR